MVESTLDQIARPVVVDRLQQLPAGERVESESNRTERSGGEREDARGEHRLEVGTHDDEGLRVDFGTGVEQASRPETNAPAGVGGQRADYSRPVRNSSAGDASNPSALGGVAGSPTVGRGLTTMVVVRPTPTVSDWRTLMPADRNRLR
jgi:hypothetical protein